MHTVELVEQAVALAERCGYLVRQDWLGGGQSGACELRGKKFIFLDLALTPIEQLEVIVATLEAADVPATLSLPPALTVVFGERKAA